MMPESSLTTDHPGWEATTTGWSARLVRTGSGLWCAFWNDLGLDVRCLQGAEDERPRLVTTDASDLPLRTPPGLSAELGRLGTTYRLANPWLWDALTTAILRQVVRAGQARALYQRWCLAHGMSLTGAQGNLALPPGPEVVLALPEAAFAEVGAAFHRTALTAAATAYLQHGPDWATLPTEELAKALDTVPRVGLWTARAAAADFSGDFSIYPYGDLAVRTWAKRADAAYPWAEQDRTFESAWQALADTPRQLHTLTLLTLTWGNHARAHPDRPDAHL